MGVRNCLIGEVGDSYTRPLSLCFEVDLTKTKDKSYLKLAEFVAKL